jgi:hypothetical protein
MVDNMAGAAVGNLAADPIRGSQTNPSIRSETMKANRRRFLTQIGSGMMVAGLGPMLARELGYASEFALDDEPRIELGELADWINLMQEMPPEKLQPHLVSQLKAGATSLRQLTAAAALANAETFGGEDYVGYHAEMALVPALRMSEELSPQRAALPVLKVLYRNTDRIQNVGGKAKKTLHPLNVPATNVTDAAMQLRSATRSGKQDEAEAVFATTRQQPVNERLEALLPTIEDDINVHRFVLAHRMVEMVDVVGAQHADSMLRQCVRFCVFEERQRIEKNGRESPIRSLLPALLVEHDLDRGQLGTIDPGAKWVGDMCDQLYLADTQAACKMVAGALADGISPEIIGEAISLAANQLVLRQGPEIWRTHGASAGVHGSDAVNAWRHIIRIAPPQHKAAGLIVAAYHTAMYGPFDHDPYPTELHREKVKTTDAAELLGIAEEAICGNDQPAAAAAIHVYGEQGYPERPVFDLMLKYAVSEDGRLHAEKYYRTVTEEFVTIRPEFRWRELVALARVTASSYGYDPKDNKGFRAAGYEEACKLLGVES